MPRFFSDEIYNDIIYITGMDAKHISKVLRMGEGDSLTVCDLKGYDYNCKIRSIEKDRVTLKICERVESDTEPSVKINLFQGFPKSDKFDFITQKAVEIGVSEIYPVMMSRSIPILDEKGKKKKIERYNRIAFEAAKQSGRSKLTEVHDFVSFVEAVNLMKEADLSLLFYEDAQVMLKTVLDRSKSPKTINIMIGPEGGFDINEVKLASQVGIEIVSLGNRILRCETAPIFALSALLFNFDSR